MWHKNRTHSVRTVTHDQAGLEELADKLLNYDWTLCTGFKYGPLFILNDSLGEDGAQEYAVWDERVGYQVESLTVSWMTRKRVVDTMTELVRAGTNIRYFEGGTRMSVEAAEVHRPCHYCA